MIEVGVLAWLAWLAVSPAEPPRLQHPRTLLAAVPLARGRVLVIGGRARPEAAFSARADAELLAVEADAVVHRGTLPLGGWLGGRAGHAAVALADGRVLVAGGDVLGSVLLYEPWRGPAGAFRPVGRLPGGPRLGPTATLLADGRVLITGGMRPSHEASGRTALFDPRTASLTEGPPLLAPRAAHAAVLLADGRVLVAGGVLRRDTELFDPDAAAFTRGPDLTSVRDDHRLTRLADGRVLIAGGQDARARSLATAELFDPADDSVRPTGTLCQDRADHVQLLLPDGRVVLLGGEHDDGANHDAVLDAVEVYDPETGTFTACPPLAEPRDDHAAVLLVDGRILVAGGQGQGDVPAADLLLYGPLTP